MSRSGKLCVSKRGHADRVILLEVHVSGSSPPFVTEAMWPMRFNQYHLIRAPVVDDEGRLIAVITIDDAMSGSTAGKHEEDIRGLPVSGRLLCPTACDRKRHRQRFPWLAVKTVGC